MAPLNEEQIGKGVEALGGWRRSEDAGPPAIEKEWQLSDFAAALRFVNSVGELAEAANHHPDILLHGWNKVRLTLSTHSQGGVTDADLALAGQIDLIA
jgi:4a-hydroxytetrahydrobiopterin dehydratase